MAEGPSKLVAPDAMRFSLSPHEVMRGIRVAGDGRLVMRQIGWVQAACVAEFLLAGALVAGLVLAGGGWLVLAVPGAGLMVGAVRRGRVAVVATASAVKIRNRWRTHEIPLAQVGDVLTHIERWPVRQPAYLFTRTAPAGRRWEIGVVALRSGGEVSCDALVSMAPLEATDGDPTPAAMKAATLKRWVADHQPEEVSP